MTEEYKKQLKDPRWILKRKFILDRDKHKCVECGSNRKLNVHHTYYSGGYMVWEYPDDSLITLCEICHKYWHDTHKIEWRSHPNGSPYKKEKVKRVIKKKKPRRKKEIKQSRLFSHATRKPRICLAQIQEHKDDFIKLKDGTWVRKKKIKE